MNRLLTSFAMLALTISADGQGTFIFDQQTDTAEGPILSGVFPTIQSYTSPWGQSFTPTLSGIDFIRLELADGNPTNGLGADVFINLVSGSISGPVIGTTTTVAMTNGFTGPVTFLFPTRVSLTPGVQYFAEPVQASGGPWDIASSEETINPRYFNGNEYNNGMIVSGEFWFREGIIAPVPEPSPVGLLLLAGCVVVCGRRIKRTQNCIKPLRTSTRQAGTVANLPEIGTGFDPQPFAGDQG